MLEIFYFIFIFPLECVLGWIVLFLNNFVSVGAAIILLSICVNLFLLKIVCYFEKKAEKINILQKECEKKIGEFKRVFKGAELQSYIRTLYKQKHFHPIFTLQGLGALALQIPFFIAMIALINHNEIFSGVTFLWIDDLSKSDSLFHLHILPILMSIFTLLNVYYSSLDRKQMIQGIFITLIFLVLLYNMASALVLYWTTNMFFALLRTFYKKNKNRFCNSILESKILSKCKNAQYSKLDKKDCIYRDISIFAILNIFFLICVFSPFAVYSSDVSQFDPTQTTTTLSTLFGIFLLSSFICIYATSFFYNTRLLKLGTFVVTVILLIGLSYTFILDYNVITGETYSQMDNFVFKNSHNISNPYAKYVDLAIGIGACIVSILLLYFARFWEKALKVISLTLVIVGLFSFFTIYTENKKLQEIKPSKNLDNLLPSFIHDLGAFSKDKQNVLVLLFDGFTGSHLKVILEQFEDFKDHLQGFTYYPNTLSLDGHTTRTAHTILTGHNLFAYAQKDKSIEQYNKIVTNALVDSFLQFASAGFEVQSYDMPHIDPSDINNPHITIIKAKQDFLPYYEKMHNIQEQVQILRAQNRPIGEMVSIGLFYFSPYVFRTRIYKDFEFGNYSWIFGAKEQIGSFINGISNISILPTIVRNLNTNANSKTFKYIHTLHTHYPFALDSSTCTPKMNSNTQLPQQYSPFISNKRHYDNEICAMKEVFILIDFLKENKIYDNTMLVLVSDHSYNDIIEHKQAYKPSIGNNPNPLLLIKDFNSNSALKVDSRLMSNADVYGILCDTLKSCNEKNILKNYPQSRELIHTLNVYWSNQSKSSSNLIFEKIWRIKDDMLDPNAFEEITRTNHE